MLSTHPRLDSGRSGSVQVTVGFKNIASQTGLPYTHRQTPDSIDVVVKNGSVNKAVNSSRSFDGYNDVYWIAIFATAVLLAFEIRNIYLPLRKF